MSNNDQASASVEEEILNPNSVSLENAISFYKQSKKSRFQDGDLKVMKTLILEHCGVVDESDLKPNFNDLLTNLHRRCKSILQRKTNYNPTEIVLNRDQIIEEELNTTTPPRAPKVRRRLSPLDKVGERQYHRRTNVVKKEILEIANQQNTSPTKLMAIGSRSINYVHHREKCKDKLKMKKDHIPVAAASYMIVYNNLSRAAYQRQIDVYKSHNRDINPPWKQVRKFQLDITPELIDLPNFLGKKCAYRTAISLTLKQILTTIETDIPNQLVFHFKDGCDGSGSHSIYNQKGNHETHNILLYMFTPLKLQDPSSNEIIWKENSPCSPHSAGPLMLFLGKETFENLQIIMEVQKEREQLAIGQIIIEHPIDGSEISVTLEGRFTMIDGKLRKIISGIGGAWCLLCTTDRKHASGFAFDEEEEEETCSMEDGESPEVKNGLFYVRKGFEIDRSMEQTQEIYDKIKSGAIAEDAPSKERLGVTQEPLIAEEILILSPLHVMLRLFDFLVRLIILLNAGIFTFSDNKNVLNRLYPFFLLSKQKLIDEVKEAFTMTIEVPDSTGKGGTSTTGNSVHTILGSCKGRRLLAGLVPDHMRDDMYEFLCRIYVLAKIYNSVEYITPYYNEFCKDTTEILLTKFRSTDKKLWIFLTPTVHGLLHHTYELIEANNGQGLLEYSESPLEANHKFMRFYRQYLSRKTSQPENLEDVFNRLWLKSDIVIRQAGEKKKPKKPPTPEEELIGPLDLVEIYMNKLVMK